MTNKEVINRFEKRFDKPIRQGVVRTLTPPNESNVYYDFSDIKSFIESEIQLAYNEGFADGKMNKII